MTDYTAFGNAIKTTLQNDSWVGNSANVKTLETHKRGFSIQDEKDARFFSPSDLPAIAVVPNAEGKQQEPGATNEIRETVPAQVIAVTRLRGAQSGLNVHHSLVANIERVLDKQKSSSADLGIGGFVREVSTTEEQFKKGEYYYFISTTTAQIELTVNF
ncbi:MAG: hypothetical protein H8E42_09295 [Nitrospinae bacterium]|nr:hypothetical protein [Nitrospinota bacterium]MBL7020695.1 hypothetical protein [Nitrospinaceae bacterium]